MDTTAPSASPLAPKGRTRGATAAKRAKPGKAGVNHEPTDSVADIPSVLGRIRARLPTLAPSNAKVAEAILRDPEGTIHITVSELAERAGTAESTAIRCCVMLGFSGFQDLKLNLARETLPRRGDTMNELTTSDKPGDVLVKVMNFEAGLLADAASSVDAAAFSKAVEALSGARSILVLGFAESYKVAVDAQDRFCSIGLSAFAPNDSNLKFVRTLGLKPGDCCLIISHSGATKDIIKCAEIARERGATTIALTSSPRSSVARRVDHVLVAGGRELMFMSDSIAGRLVHLAIIDALYMSLLISHPERSAEFLRFYEDVGATWQL
jgi:DNA-binding MurR/RpiR family transcriptional regulator